MGAVQRLAEEKKTKTREARDRQKTGKYGGMGGTYRGYVSYPRTAAIKAQFDAYSDDGALVAADFHELVTLGFKLTVTVDNKDGSVRAQFMSTDEDRADVGLVLGVFGESAWDTQVLAVFYVAVCGQFSLNNEFFTLPDSGAKRTFWQD